MPGIAGLISPGSPDARKSTVEQMVGVMRREPFYSSGVLGLERAAIAAGWAVHQGGFADCLPLWNGKGDVCLMFTGEAFPEPSGAEDGRFLVEAYDNLGPAFLDELNGCVSGVVVDLRQDKVILFNDRYGLSRVYWHEGADGFLFSSEAKSLLRVNPGLRRIDPVGLAEYGACGCALQDRTLFAGVSLLPPASRWTFSSGRLERKESYFRRQTWEQQARLGEEEYYQRMKETFRRIVPKYFRGRNRVGMSLTGGLDGRMIIAGGSQAPGTLPCYTFGGTYRDCTDVAIARRIARACGQPHQVIEVGSAFYPQFPALAESAVYVSDGAMDVTGSVELYCNRLAREIAPVRMTGNYGSEILRGNVAFGAHALSPELFSAEYLKLGSDAAATFAQEAQGRRLSLIAFKQVPWHHPTRLSVEQTQLTMRSPYLDNELVALTYQAPASLEFSKVPALRYSYEGNAALGSIATDRGLDYPPTPVLTKLHNLYQEFTFKAEYAYDYGMPQWIARIDHALAPLHLENLFLGRHKFYHFRVWYRDRFQAYLREMLLDPRTTSRAHVNAAGLRTMVQEHISGRRNYTSELHQALSIELIHRQLIERAW